eukprot:1333638-Amorphochlora_amoeboformis.AAC.2
MHPPPSARRASSVDFAVFFVVFACSFPYAQGSRPGMVSSPFFAQKAAMAWGPYFRQGGFHCNISVYACMAKFIWLGDWRMYR